MVSVQDNSSDANREVNGPPAPLWFYFDFISPFGYLASLRVDALAARYGREARWQAMLIGVSVMKVMGLKPVPQTPLKGPYTRRDLLRYARRHGISLARDFDAPPPYPIPGARAFHWLDSADPVVAKSFARALFAAYWQQGRDIGSVAEVARIGEGVGVEGAELVAAIASGGEGDVLLRSAVDRSLALGVFGSPFFIVDGEPFFGLEKLPVVEEWLAAGGW
jgi:2-hydroxychromene-2-carboxylate isomerase